MTEPLAARPHALYRMFDHAGALLYVGISVDVGSRFDTHSSEQSWWTTVRSVTLEHFGSRADALRAEVIAIRSERPLHNIVHRTCEAVTVARARVKLAKWNRLWAATAVMGTDRSKVINDFIDWYLRERGASLPERPSRAAVDAYLVDNAEQPPA